MHHINQNNYLGCIFLESGADSIHHPAKSIVVLFRMNYEHGHFDLKKRKEEVGEQNRAVTRRTHGYVLALEITLRCSSRFVFSFPSGVNDLKAPSKQCTKI